MNQAKELTRKDLYEMFCKQCRKAEGQCCSGAGDRGYCDQNPMVIPEGTWVESPGINWTSRVFGSEADAQEFEKTVRHRHDQVRYGRHSLGGMQVIGYGVHFHKFD